MTDAAFRYEVIIYWSDEDDAFIAEVPELPGCAADGPTHRDAGDRCPNRVDGCCLPEPRHVRPEVRSYLSTAFIRASPFDRCN
jgi:hypothetical protein